MCSGLPVSTATRRSVADLTAWQERRHGAQKLLDAQKAAAKPKPKPKAKKKEAG